MAGEVLPGSFSSLMVQEACETFGDGDPPRWSMEKPQPSDLTRITHLIKVNAQTGAQLYLTSRAGSFHRAPAHPYCRNRVRLLGLRMNI